MKITDVRVHLLEAAVSQPFAYSHAWDAKWQSLIVEIETHQGLTGWGDAMGRRAGNMAMLVCTRLEVVGLSYFAPACSLRQRAPQVLADATRPRPQAGNGR